MSVSIYKKVSHSLLVSKRALIGWLIILSVVFTAIFAPFISPFDPMEQKIEHRLKPPGWKEGSAYHILGTDQLGRDIASRIIYGTRITLAVGIFALFIGAILGVTIGLVSGYVGGKTDSFFMRLADIQLALPYILLIIAIVAVLGQSTRNIIIILGVTTWVDYARIIRSEVLSLREREFIMAAKALGVSNLRIIFSHLLPNVGPSCIVMATLEIGRIMLSEAGISFLGLGVPPPTVTWGGMLADGRTYIFTSWWLATFPGLALMSTVLGVFMVGDWFRDFLR
jgi:peptide/nickel transport system permease protein